MRTFLEARYMAGSADDFRTRFRFFGISSVGVERNGFVAGFGMKY
jgi:hypothetical protein